MSDSNYSEDMNLTVAYMSGVEGGKALERAKIVAWLKSKSHHAGSRENELAEAIEEGEHVK